MDVTRICFILYKFKEAVFPGPDLELHLYLHVSLKSNSDLLDGNVQNTSRQCLRKQNIVHYSTSLVLASLNGTH